MTILALDLATKLGCCWGPPQAVPTLGHFTLPSTGELVGKFLCAYEDWLNAKIDEVAPTHLIFEAPVMPRPKFNKITNKIDGTLSIATTRKLQGLAGVTEMVAERRNLAAGRFIIDCREVQPAEAKKALTGSGGAKKPQMVSAARALGFDPHTYRESSAAGRVEASDEADALGVWLAWVRLKFPQHSARWEPLFASRASA